MIRVTPLLRGEGTIMVVTTLVRRTAMILGSMRLIHQWVVLEGMDPEDLHPRPQQGEVGRVI